MSHDGSSVLLDRFGLLLVLVLSTVVGQALIDVGGSLLGASVAHAISGAGPVDGLDDRLGHLLVFASPPL